MYHGSNGGAGIQRNGKWRGDCKNDDMHRRYPWLISEAAAAVEQSGRPRWQLRLQQIHHNFPWGLLRQGPGHRQGSPVSGIPSLAISFAEARVPLWQPRLCIRCISRGAAAPPPGFSFRDTWREFAQSEERLGWWKGEGYDEMHVQGRMWGGTIPDRFNAEKGMDCNGSIYDARPTFESYGVPHGHADLIKAVPENQKKFLQDLVWVHEEDEVYTGEPEMSCTKLIAVHAGLEKTKGVEEQLKVLYNRDVTLPRVEALSGRKNVWDAPMELLENKVMLISGHHGTLHVGKLRLIIDEGGGLEQRPIAAIVFPSGTIIRDTDFQAEG